MNKKIFISVLLICFLLTSNAFAKKYKGFSLHLKGGGILTDHLTQNVTSTLGYKVGIEFENSFTSLFSLQYGLLYSGLTRASSSGITSASGTIVEVSRLSIPFWFKFRFRIYKSFGVYVGPGLTFNTYLNTVTIDGRTDVSLGVFDFGFGTLFGLHYYINNRVKVFFDFNLIAYAPSNLSEFSFLPGVAFIL